MTPTQNILWLSVITGYMTQLHKPQGTPNYITNGMIRHKNTKLTFSVSGNRPNPSNCLHPLHMLTERSQNLPLTNNCDYKTLPSFQSNASSDIQSWQSTPNHVWHAMYVLIFTSEVHCSWCSHVFWLSSSSEFPSHDQFSPRCPRLISNLCPGKAWSPLRNPWQYSERNTNFVKRKYYTNLHSGILL
mgnify:CR=1 FL=1